MRGPHEIIRHLLALVVISARARGYPTLALSEQHDRAVGVFLAGVNAQIILVFLTVARLRAYGENLAESTQATLDALRAETTRKRGRWNSLAMLVLWVPLAAFADPPSFGDVWGGLPYRIPTALGFFLLWLWLGSGKQRSRRAVESGVTLAFSFLFVVWGAFVARCSADTVLPAMLSIVGGAMVITSGLTLTWQSTALLCFVADAAMLSGGLLRTPRPEPTYFMLVATGLILYPFVVSGAAARDRRYFAELESSRKLAELNEQLRLEQDARTRLFVNLSHDFRTPLAVIRAEVELLRMTAAREPGRALARIDSNAAAVVDLVEQLLELARLDVGKTPLSAGPCDLRALAGEVVARLPAAARRYRPLPACRG